MIETADLRAAVCNRGALGYNGGVFRSSDAEGSAGGGGNHRSEESTLLPEVWRRQSLPLRGCVRNRHSLGGSVKRSRRSLAMADFPCARPSPRPTGLDAATLFTRPLRDPCDVLIRATVQNPKRVGINIFFIRVRTRTYRDFGASRNLLFRTDSCNTAPR